MSELVTQILQDPQLTQALGRNKAVQVNVQIVGDSAINKASAKDGNIFAALEWILEELPQPKWKNLLAYSALIIYQKTRVWQQTAKYLGYSQNTFEKGTTARDRVEKLL